MEREFLDWLQQRIQAAVPNVSVGPDSAIYHLVLRPAAIINENLWGIINNIESYFFLSNFDPTVDPTLLEQLASNFFVSKTQGAVARGTLTVRYGELGNVRIERGATVSDAENGLVFVVTDSYYVPADRLRDHYNGGYYEIRISVAAALPGSQYNLPANSQFVPMGGFYGPTIMQIFNEEPLAGGADAETYNQLLAKVLVELPRVPGTLSAGGLLAWVYQYFGDRVRDATVFTAGSRWLLRQSCSKRLYELTTCSRSLGDPELWPIAGISSVSTRLKWFSDVRPASDPIGTYSAASSQIAVSYEISPDACDRGDVVYFLTASGGSLWGPYYVANPRTNPLDPIQLSVISVPLPGSDATVIQLMVLGRQKEWFPSIDLRDWEVDAYVELCRYDLNAFMVGPFMVYLQNELTYEGPSPAWEAGDARSCATSIVPDSVRQALYQGMYTIVFGRHWDGIPTTWYFNQGGVWHGIPIFRRTEPKY